MQFHKLTFDDYQVFKKYSGKDINYENSFITVYIWSKVYETFMAIEDDCMYLYSIMEGICEFDPPTCPNSFLLKWIDNCVAYSKQMHNKYHITILQHQYEYLQSINSSLKFEQCLWKQDYIYKIDDLSEFKGSKLQSKRNLWYQFNDKYKYEFLPYNNDYDALKAFLEELKKDSDRDLLEKLDLLALENLTKFGLECFILYINKQIAGFCIFKREETSVEIVFEKANTKYQGVYAALVKLEAEKNTDKIYMNRQDDLGIEGLRRSKKSYNPIRIIDKYIMVDPT